MGQKILLLTKNYPPQIGGMEKYSHDLHKRLIAEGNEVKIIAAGPRNEWLLTKKGTNSSLMQIVWKFGYIASELCRLGWFALRCLTIGWYQSYVSEIVWSLDGSIAGVAFLLGKVIRTKTRVTIHGTDIVWNRKIYQTFVPKIIAKMDEVYVISENTCQECLKRGIPASKITLVPHTLNTISFIDPGNFDKSEFLKNLGVENPEGRIILFSIGRWIERKGFHWFLENVLVALDSSKFHYVLAGFGPMENHYRNIVANSGISNITFLGKIDEITKSKMFLSANLFIMPNLYVEGDIEGYGLVLLEAQYYKLSCIVSDIDGIGGRVISGKDIILPLNSPSLWIQQINLISKIVTTVNK